MQFKFKKAVQAINYIAENNNGKVHRLKAIKLLWFADRLHLRKYGRTITGDTYVAMPYGPVASKTLDIIKRNSSFDPTLKSAIEYGDNYLTTKEEFILSTDSTNSKVFSQTDLESLKTVLENYNEVDRFDLAEISHEFPEWNRFEERFKYAGPKRFDMDIYDFFQNVETYDLFSDSEEDLEIVKEVFLENQQFEVALQG